MVIELMYKCIISILCIFLLTEPVQNDQMEKGLAQHLLSNSEEKQNDNDEYQECDVSEEGSEDSNKPVTSIGSAYRLLTPSIKVCSWIQIITYLHSIFIRKMICQFY